MGKIDRRTAVQLALLTVGASSLGLLWEHTPGHAGYILKSGDEFLFCWGDIVHLPSVQLANPDVGVVIFDTNPTETVETRRAVLDLVTSERMHVDGAHLEFPSVGYVERRESGFAFVPELSLTMEGRLGAQAKGGIA